MTLYVKTKGFLAGLSGLQKTKRAEEPAHKRGRERAQAASARAMGNTLRKAKTSPRRSLRCFKKGPFWYELS